ncbi:MAG: ABC transporter ATP-binding protein [Candidatus Hodarchaeales archaeon]|jgi:oligopeptide/dipeptide ABC transporter ATP-binding protein
METNYQNLLLEIEELRKHFPISQKGIVSNKKIGDIKALDGVNLKVKRGEILGIVGESGSGKTTLARVVLNLTNPTAGNALLNTNLDFQKNDSSKDGFDIYLLRTRKQELWFRKTCQIVFQDPYSSLNPRMTVLDIISEALIIHHPTMDRKVRKKRVIELLSHVGLEDYHASRYPHEFSGGQRQRIGIARALAVEPEIIILDEPVSALDVAVQAQILNLLLDLREKFNLTYIFIAHDLSVVRHISERIAVMYLGKIVELAPAEDFFQKFAHPYTEALISAVPIPNPLLDRKRIILEGEQPSPLNPPSGCSFRTRCMYAQEKCADQNNPPQIKQIGADHHVACFFPLYTAKPYAE